MTSLLYFDIFCPMSMQEAEGAIPVPIGDPVITYNGKIIQVVEQRMLIGSTETVYERARRSPGTRLLIISPNHNILLTREYRDEIGRWDYRLPGGKVFDSLEEYSEAVRNGVDLLDKSKQAARKEAQEEVACAPSSPSSLSLSNRFTGGLMGGLMVRVL